jgi:hypothetical protein
LRSAKAVETVFATLDIRALKLAWLFGAGHGKGVTLADNWTYYVDKLEDYGEKFLLGYGTDINLATVAD